MEPSNTSQTLRKRIRKRKRSPKDTQRKTLGEISSDLKSCSLEEKTLSELSDVPSREETKFQEWCRFWNQELQEIIDNFCEDLCTTTDMEQFLDIAYFLTPQIKKARISETQDKALPWTPQEKWFYPGDYILHELAYPETPLDHIRNYCYVKEWSLFSCFDVPEESDVWLWLIGEDPWETLEED